MPKYTCERCLKEFSQKSHYTKHENKKLPCQDNKGKIEEVIENIIINKKLISHNTENNLLNSHMSKKQLGQFYTTNYEYILSNMKIPNNVKTIVEPFVGNGDLLKFIKKTNYMLEIYDIDPKITDTIKRDTLKNPPDYTDKFILTNPPYLARNKSQEKDIYEKYKCDDLYKCFIINIISNVCQGGIIIIPLNFISSIRKADIELRKKFLEKYSVKIINIFEEQVFDDTSYAVCSIYFVRKQNDELNSNINLYIYPSKKEMKINFTSENNYTIGGDIYNLPQNSKYIVERATKKTKENITNILLKCIDDNINSQLGFKIVSDEKKFIDNTKNLSARSYATLVINKSLTLEEQEYLVDKMNEFIKEQRKKYNSLFLTNYRESNSIARKRISFDLAFKICNYMLSSI